MKAVGRKAECKIRREDFTVLFCNIRSICRFNRFIVGSTISADVNSYTQTDIPKRFFEVLC